MRPPPSEAEIERAVAAAYAFLREQDGLLPHALIDDLIGLEAYRKFMRCPDMEMLAAFAEEALPLEEALDVAAHEKACPVCRADIADLRGFVRQQVTQVLSSTPIWATGFVGREDLRAALSATLAAGGAPTVTLAAAQGVGKTRLLLETAVEQAYRYPDGVLYVPVIHPDDADLTAAEIACAARLSLQPNRAPLPQLRAFFTDRRALIALDDVPPSSPAAQLLAAITDGDSMLRCLTTAPDALGLPGERRLDLPPLRMPEDARDAERILASESAQLFTERIHAFAPDYRFTEEAALSTAILCRRAAGMPLAIEFLAAGVQEMSPQEMARRLETRHPAAAPGESLTDLLAWTVDRLSAREQRLLQRLSVFAEGFGAEQAAIVCEEEDAETLIERLTQKALLQRLNAPQRARYRMLPPIRRFAQNRLPDRADLARRHRVFFLQFAEARAERLGTAAQVEAMQELAADLPNLRTGIESAQEADDWTATGRYGLALRSFWMLRGLWQECDQRLRLAVEAFGHVSEERQREQAEIALARCLIRKGDYTEAEERLQAVAAAAAQREDAATLVEAKNGLGNAAQLQGRYREATACFEETLRQYEALGDRWGAADSRHNLGWLAWMQGDYERAERLFREILPVERERGDRYRLGTTLACLGNIAFEQGRLEEARAYFEESLWRREELGDLRGIAGATTNLGMVWQALGDVARAEFCYAQAARYLEQIGETKNRTLAQVFLCQGDLALLQSDLSLAHERFEAAYRQFAALGDALGHALALGGLGKAAWRAGRMVEARETLRESLTRLIALGDPANVAVALGDYGQFLAAQGETERAALLLNVALRLCIEKRRPEQKPIEAALRQIETSLGPERAAALRAQAAILDLQAILPLVS